MKQSLQWTARIALVGALAGATPAFATLTVYTDRAAFDAATTGQTSYGFPEFTGVFGAGIGLEYIKGPVTFSVPTFGLGAWDDGSYGPQPYLAVDSAAGAFTVSTAQSALGLYLGDYHFDDTPNYSFGALSGTINVPMHPDLTFIGFTNDSGPVAVTIDGRSGELALPEFVVATAAGAIPEPASWAMMIGGLALAGGAMRRRPAKVAIGFC